MENILKIGTCLFCGLLATFSLHSQDLFADLTQVFNNHLESESLSFEVNVKVFGKESEQPIFKDQAFYLHDEDKVKLDFNGVQKMIIGKELMVLDKDRKVFHLLTGNKKTSKEIRKELAGLDVETLNLEKEKDAVQYLGMEQGVKKYILLPKEGEFNKIIVEINSDPFFLHKIEYSYNPSLFPDLTFSVVTYDKVSFDSLAATAGISMDNYLEKKNGQYQLKSAYENYELILTENE